MRALRLAPIALALALALLAPSARAAYVIDQSNSGPLGPGTGISGRPTPGQSFTAGLGGIDFARFQLVNFNGPTTPTLPATLSVSLYAGAGTSGTALATTASVVLTGPFGNLQTLEFSFASRVALTVGAIYTIGLNPIQNGEGVALLYTRGDTYSGGTLIVDGTPDAGSDAIFATGIIVPDAVPEPGSMALLGLGLAGVGIVARRRAA